MEPVKRIRLGPIRRGSPACGFAGRRNGRTMAPHSTTDLDEVREIQQGTWDVATGGGARVDARWVRRTRARRRTQDPLPEVRQRTLHRASCGGGAAPQETRHARTGS